MGIAPLDNSFVFLWRTLHPVAGRKFGNVGAGIDRGIAPATREYELTLRIGAECRTGLNSPILSGVDIRNKFPNPYDLLACVSRFLLRRHGCWNRQHQASSGASDQDADQHLVDWTIHDCLPQFGRMVVDRAAALAERDPDDLL